MLVVLACLLVARAAATPLVVMHYNLWNFDSGPHWERRKGQIAQVIKSSTLTPDIISFNEVRKRKSSNGQVTQDMFEDMRKLLPEYPHGYYSVGEDYGDVEEGVAVVSRHPILQKDFIKLALGNGGDSNHRVCIFIQVKLPPNQHVSMFVTHWSYDRKQQLSNARETVAFVKSKPGPHVLSGDLNIYADYEDPMQVMHIHKGEVFFRDTGFEWKSDLKAEGFTFSSWDPHNRADRILIRGPGLSVSRMLVVGKATSKEQAPSDHMGVVVKLLMAPQSYINPDHIKAVDKLVKGHHKERKKLFRDYETERALRHSAEQEMAEIKSELMSMRLQLSGTPRRRDFIPAWPFIMCFVLGAATFALVKHLCYCCKDAPCLEGQQALLPSRSLRSQKRW